MLAAQNGFVTFNKRIDSKASDTFTKVTNFVLLGYVCLMLHITKQMDEL